ncbi:MAG: alpha/beta hydrolase-fold protein [Pseudomonadota bacterium]
MRDGIIPFIDKEFRADPDRRVLVGQSYGGLFGVFALLEEPGLFSDYILTSPSLCFGQKAIFDMEAEAAAEQRPLSGKVYFATGETEQPNFHGGRIDMVADQASFADILASRNHSGLSLKYDTIEDGTHQTTFPIGFTRGMLWILPGDDPYNGGQRWYGD